MIYYWHRFLLPFVTIILWSQDAWERLLSLIDWVQDERDGQE